MGKKNFYAIARGLDTGIFQDDWNLLRLFVINISDASYKGFNDIKQAENWLYNHRNCQTIKIDPDKIGRSEKTSTLLEELPQRLQLIGTLNKIQTVKESKANARARRKNKSSNSNKNTNSNSNSKSEVDEEEKKKDESDAYSS